MRIFFCLHEFLVGHAGYDFFCFPSRISATCNSSSSASATRPWALYISAREVAFFNMSGCSSPNVCLCVSKTLVYSSSASATRPWSLYICTREVALYNVSGCSSPNTLFCVSKTFTANSLA